MKLLSADDVADFLSVSTEEILEWTEAGKFPLPLKLGERVVRWRQEVIEAWITLLPLATVENVKASYETGYGSDDFE